MEILWIVGGAVVVFYVVAGLASVLSFQYEKSKGAPRTRVRP